MKTILYTHNLSTQPYMTSDIHITIKSGILTPKTRLEDYRFVKSEISRTGANTQVKHTNKIQSY